MGKAELCNFIRSKYPKAFGIRKRLQQLKVQRLRRHMLTAYEVLACEKDPAEKKRMVEACCAKWEGPMRPIIEEMEDILKHSTLLCDRSDLDELRTDILYCRLAFGFLPSEYVGFGLEQCSKEERESFVSDIDTFEFGYSVNDITVLQSIVNKGQSAELFSQYFGRDIFWANAKASYEDFRSFVTKHPRFVKKKTNSAMGKNIEVVEIDKVGKNEREYFDELLAKGSFLLEEIIVQHEEMARYNSSSVNTIRCMTMKTKDNGVVVPFTFMRTGREGSFVDNGGSGGILIGVDEKTGMINTDGYDEYMHHYPEHPDTHVPFCGNQVPAWEEMLEFCKKAAEKVEGMGYLSWDMAYTDKGWVVIEVNGIGQMIGPQTVTKKGNKEKLTKLLAQMEKVI